jgi:spore coat polysaccharide biosynthesis predicted glycosyltransferase SpsG
LSKLPDLSEQLLWADACITGGGLIKYEAIFMGVPGAAIAQNEGQDQETRSLMRAGLVFDLGLADERSDAQLEQAMDTFLADPGLRQSQIARGEDLFPPDPPGKAAGAILAAIGN